MSRTVIDYLNRTVGEVPDKTAFSDGEVSLTFRRLYEISRSVGSFLARKSIFRKPVAIYMKRSPMEVAAIFGVATGGCHYVPIDEKMPDDRVRLMMDKVRPGLVICDVELYEKALKAAGSGCGAVIFDEIKDFTEDCEALDRIHEKVIDTDPLYILFTSGSTGIPKGVAASNRSVLDYIERISDVLGFRRDTVFGNQAPLHIDACLRELYPTIRYGATTFLIPEKLFAAPYLLVDYLNKHGINTICWVASALSLVSSFSTFEDIKPRYLRTITFCGEVFPVKQFNLWKAAVPDADYFNLYGPTESTGACCYYRVDRDFGPEERIPIGGPLENREILLIKEDNSEAEDGEKGEICVRGSSVTLGYYNDPENTAVSFVQNPLNNSYIEFVYKTGDIGIRNERGELEFVSRKDRQIKRMGHRIEPGEIESIACSAEGVDLSVCTYEKGSDRILLFYKGEIGEAALASHLAAGLPKYMMPSEITKVDWFPLTSNGKIDVKRMSAKGERSNEQNN